MCLSVYVSICPYLSALWYHCTRKCIHKRVITNKGVAPLWCPRASCRLPSHDVPMFRMLIALSPPPVRFPPGRGWGCDTVLCRTPVGPDLPTEARCRLALPTRTPTGQPANYLPKIIDTFYTNSPITTLHVPASITVR